MLRSRTVMNKEQLAWLVAQEAVKGLLITTNIPGCLYMGNGKGDAIKIVIPFTETHTRMPVIRRPIHKGTSY